MSNSPTDFTLHINSTNYLERFGSLNDQSYSFNSTRLEAGKYKIKFSYRGGSEPIATVNLSQFATIYISFGSVQSVYQIGGNNNFSATQCVGFSLQHQFGTTSFCYSDIETNPQVYIDYNPSNVIRVTLKSGTTGNLYTGTTDYMLFLQFSKCD